MKVQNKSNNTTLELIKKINNNSKKTTNNSKKSARESSILTLENSTLDSVLKISTWELMKKIEKGKRE